MAYLTAIYKSFGSEYISDDRLLTLIGSIGQVCNACGRISVNYLMEKLGFKKILFLLNAVACVQVILISAAVKHTNWYMVWMFGIFYIQGGINGIIPGSSAYLFGIKTGAQVLGFFMVAQAITNWIEYALLVSMREYIDYSGLYYLNFGILLCTLCGIIAFRPAVNWTQENKKWAEGAWSRQQKALAKQKKSANHFLKKQLKLVQEDNFKLNYQLQEIRAYIKYNLVHNEHYQNVYHRSNAKNSNQHICFHIDL